MSAESTGRKLIPGRRGASAASVAVAVIVIAASAAAIAAGIISTDQPRRHHAAASHPLPPCLPAQTASSSGVPTRLGAWAFTPLERGTFAAVTAGGHGGLLALQACGAEETALRVLEVFPGRSRSLSAGAVASAEFARAAPVASSLLATSDAVWFGEARLALGGRLDEAPYRLTLHELDPTSLAERRSIPLGRGYGVTLLAAPAGFGSVVVSTGRALDLVSSSGSVRSLATFPGVVVQHASVVRGAHLAVVSVFTPSAVPPAPSTALEVIDLESGQVVSSLSLAHGGEVEALAAGTSDALAVVGNAGSTAVDRLSLDPLAITPVSAAPVPATLTPLAIAPTGSGPGFVYGATTLACVDLESGSVVASTTPDGPAEEVSGIAETEVASGAGSLGSSGSHKIASVSTVAILPSGIGTVDVPASCR